MKKVLTGILSLALAASMSATAFAANSATNNGETGSDITVNGKYQAGAAGGDIISVDIAWEAMDFTYTAPSKGVWNPVTHKYEGAAVGGWKATGGTDPKITVKNHSNTAVDANFTFASAVEGLSGNFTNNTLTLKTAVDTERENAPTGETAFSVSGTGIDADKALGTITVTVAKSTSIFTAEELLATANKTGAFKLAGNIELGTTRFSIDSESYVLDLNGFTISGSADRESIIFASASSNVTVKNGTVNNTSSEYGWAVHEKSAALVLENCNLISYSSGLFSENGTAKLKDCNIKTILVGHYNITNYTGCKLTISGNMTISGGAGLSDQLGATTTALPGTYNFDVSGYVDTNLYDVTNDGATWTVAAK